MIFFDNFIFIYSFDNRYYDTLLYSFNGIYLLIYKGRLEAIDLIGVPTGYMKYIFIQFTYISLFKNIFLKVAIITKLDLKDNAHSGVWNKILGIVEGFKKNDCGVDLYCLKDSVLVKGHDTVLSNKLKLINHSFFSKLVLNFPFGRYDIIFIRHSLFAPSLIRFLKLVCIKNPKCKILYEIPTYPYRYEFSNSQRILLWLHERLVMKRLKRYVHFVLACSKEPLFNIPTLLFTNGINVDKYTSFPAHLSTTKFIAIGVLWNHFGLDRMMRHNLEELSCSLEVLGEGPRLQYLKSIANESSSIVFSGKKHISNALNKDYSYIGVGTLGAHRKHVASFASLKHREYAACGIPFIYAGDDPDFPESCGFVYKVPADDSPIDVKAVLEWYNSLTITPDQIRQYAIDRLDWKVVIKRLLVQIQSPTHS